MSGKLYWVRFVAAILTVILLVTPLVACDDDDEDQHATEPIKIGVLTAWSGSAGGFGSHYATPIMDLVEDQVREMGGILGGRQVEFVKGDTEVDAATTLSAATKLVRQDNVSLLTVGGVTAAQMATVSDFAEENEIPFFSLSDPRIDLDERDFTVNCGFSQAEMAETTLGAIIKLLEPNTIAWLVKGTEDGHDRVGSYKAALEDVGIETVYEAYTPSDTTDFSSYLTAIQHIEPDLVYLDQVTDHHTSVATQVMTLGGWGDSEVMTDPAGADAAGFPGAEGYYLRVPWSPGLEYPGAKKFEEDFYELHGTQPQAVHVYVYNTLWTAIHAIELADIDDPEDIAEAARSGELAWETPVGLAHWSISGQSDMHSIIVQIQEGELVPVPLPE